MFTGAAIESLSVDRVCIWEALHRRAMQAPHAAMVVHASGSQNHVKAQVQTGAQQLTQHVRIARQHSFVLSSFIAMSSTKPWLVGLHGAHIYVRWAYSLNGGLQCPPSHH